MANDRFTNLPDDMIENHSIGVDELDTNNLTPSDEISLFMKIIN